MLEEILRLTNEWWLSKEISAEKSRPYHRTVFGDLKTLLKYRQIVILTGLRRVGKTTLMFQLIRELLEKVSEKNILYFNFDEKAAKPLDVLKEYGRLTGVNWKKEKCFVFFDEVQKIGDWSSKIKLLYDNLPNLKIFVSGSASLMLEAEATSNLAGRYFSREVGPLSLKEFTELYLNKKINRLELYRDYAERLFHLYEKRPFPEIVRWEDDGKVHEYVKELVVDKILKIDLQEIFKVNVNLLSALAEMFLRNPGTILNQTDLAKDLKVHKTTLKDHLFYLEFAKIIKTIKNLRPSVRAESRKMKKIYPFNISLSFPYYPSLDKGSIFEALAAPGMKNYWREGTKEVDFIKREKNLLPVEVKAKGKLKKKELRSLVYFMKKYGVKEGMVIYSGENKTEKIDSAKVRFVNMIDFLW